MTEPTYTEAEIRKAIVPLISQPVGVNVDKVIAYLKRPKHDFAEGQVVVAIDSGNIVVWRGDRNSELYCHLNMTELGPHVQALRDALISISHQDFNGSMQAKARSALKAFDKAVGEEE